LTDDLAAQLVALKIIKVVRCAGRRTDASRNDIERVHSVQLSASPRTFRTLGLTAKLLLLCLSTEEAMRRLDLDFLRGLLILAHNNSGTPSEWPVHSSQQPSNTQSN
jgi:hypothetical protein